MKRKNLIIQLALSMLFPLQNASAQKGYPERESINGIYEKFQTPPPGYGEVPFYWWQADTLTKERLTWQLDELAKKKISSLQINYSHTDDRKGYFWGSSYKSVPAQFTEEWWPLFGWFMKEANRRGMTVSVSDYTLGVGQGYAIDEVRKLHPDIAASELVIETKDINGGERYECQIKNELVSITAFNKENPKEHIVLTDKVSNGQVKWNCPKGKWTVATAYSVRQDRSYNPMHPLAGKEYVRCFFQRFEDKFPNDSKGALNFFFSDELNFNIKGIAWDERFATEFQKRKGYDIRPLIAALKMDIGAITTKVRLDYNDVFTSLSEENFFIPVYNWHAERNLIYGCDHGGRGRDVDEFGDYFRTQRWNQGPGSDQPRLGKNIIKAKVASSIAHMYNRPRVWLEGFYSSGWGTTSGKLLDAIFANYAMGYNLLSLHGLYYATPGSMWEWAPPCNHFRMPYWAVMYKMLEATERLSYLLSQGYHKCDVAIVYPVEPTVAGYGNNASDTAFKAGEMLYNKGIDFDFVDYSSLMKAKYNNGHLNISGEEYKAVIVPSMKAIRDSALVVLAKFASQGGTVINIGDLPETTEAYGKDEKHVGKLVAEMTSGKNFTRTENCDNLDIILDKHFVRDFSAVDNQSNDIFINHRKADSLNIYGIYNAEKNSRCFFRCHGDVEYWDIWSGEKYKIENCEKTEHGTIVNMPKGKEEFQIIVFTPRSNAQIFKDAETESIKLADKWECEIIPVLDNRFGDYHYPGTNEKLRPEIRHYNYLLSKEKSLKEAKLLAENGKASEVTYTYGDEFMYSGATNEVLSDEFLAGLKCAPKTWKPYRFSRRWGVENDPGHQGYHGMKMKMNPEVIRLGRMVQNATSTSREAEKEGNKYYMFTTVKAPYCGTYKIETGKEKPSRCFINGKKVDGTDMTDLNEGINYVVLCYDKPVITYFFIRDTKKETSESPRLTLPWYENESILPFDPYVSDNSYGWYFFTSAPGLNGFSVKAKGDAKVWINGEKAKSFYEGNLLNVKTNKTIKEPADAAIRIKLPFGIKGGAGMAGELIQNTGTGIIEKGDWGQTEGLRNYSGGIKYIQNVDINPEMLGGKVLLKFDDISSAAEVTVNGKESGVRLCGEWSFDITDAVKTGENRIEVTVYNTASNHYETIPTQFKGQAPSGILGNAYIVYEKSQR